MACHSLEIGALNGITIHMKTERWNGIAIREKTELWYLSAGMALPFIRYRRPEWYYYSRKIGELYGIITMQGVPSRADGRASMVLPSEGCNRLAMVKPRWYVP